MTAALGMVAVGLAGFFACALRPDSIDGGMAWVHELARSIYRRLAAKSAENIPELAICSRLVASLRAGQSLDAAVEGLTGQSTLPPETLLRLRRVLDGRPERDFLSQFLDAAIRSGIPVLSVLQSFQKTLLTRKRLALRARAITGQARAQAAVLSWLPWSLALGIVILDVDWFSLACKSWVAWLLWGISIALVGAGRGWIRVLLRRALAPKNQQEKLEEEELPELILRIVAEISVGRDVESALEAALSGERTAELRNQVFNGRSEKAEYVRALVAHAATTGAPIRDDLLSFLQELYGEIEARWEERVQKLPVVLLLPLFACFFPASLLVMLGLLFPLLLGFQ